MTLSVIPNAAPAKRRRNGWMQTALHTVSATSKPPRPPKKSLPPGRRQAGFPCGNFFNTSGLKYKELGLKDKLPEMPEDRQLALLASDGMLVKRPLLIGGTGAAPAVLVGFREAEWQQLL